MRAYERFCSQFAGHTLILPTTEYLADSQAAEKAMGRRTVSIRC